MRTPGTNISRDGTVYGSGRAGNYVIRRHSVHYAFDINGNKAKLAPLLCYKKSSPLSATLNDYGGNPQTIHPRADVQEGSRVNSIKLDILITPTTESDSTVIDFYTARIQTSFHDLQSGEIRGLGIDDDQQPVFAQDDKTPGTAAECASGAGPELSFSKQIYDYSVTIKHWWRGMSKQILASGVPVMYNRREFVPPKCKRSNRGMFYGMVFMNDSSASLHVDIKLNFTEIPLVQ